MSEIEGTVPNGTQAKPTPEEAAVKIATDAAAKVAADKAAADSKLLDGNGNPKSEEVLAAERAATDQTKTTDQTFIAEQDELKGKVTGRAKQVEDLIKAAKIDPASMVTGADQETGEISVAHKAKLIETHGEAIADLIEGNIQKIIGDTRKHGKAKDDAVFKQVELEFKGVTEQKGSETWKELAGWVKDNMPKETRKEYNAMLTAGGLQAKLAVKEMVTAFKKDNDMTISATLVDGDDAPKVAGTFITRSEYMKQLDVLRKAGHDYDTSPEIALLNKKRERSMQNGK
jgi:hypothetical protein